MPLKNDEVCSGAEQNTDLYVKTEITGLNKSALANRVPEEFCNDIPKIEEVQHKMFFIATYNADSIPVAQGGAPYKRTILGGDHL